MTDHYVDVVDENDNVVGKELKSKKPELGFISRVASIMIRDSTNNFVVCKRESNKEIGAEKYDLAACGNVHTGEDYEQAAKRELQEELGIDCPVKLLDKFYQEIEHKGKKFRVFCGVFLGHSDDEPKLNEELISFKRMTLEEIETEMTKNPQNFCPGFINDFNQVKSKLRN